MALRPHLAGAIGDDGIRRVTGNEALEIPGEIAIDLGVDDIG
jgi:hypothetical protein